MKKRHILAVTGIRSEYDIMYSVYRAIEKNEALELSLIVTGAHLSEASGYSVREIEKDGFHIVERIESLIHSNSRAGRLKGMAVQLQGMIQTIERMEPDFLMVLGDREEAMTTALAGAYLDIPVAHLCGGDRAIGNVDDQVRHAVSKLAHLHLVSNAESYERVLRLGEQPFRVHNVGNPGLDRLLDVPVLSDDELGESMGFPVDSSKPLLLLIQHVISSESEQGYEQMRCTMEAVKRLEYPCILSYPNTDAGSHDIIRAIDEYAELPFLWTARNIPRLEFVNIMRRASCMLGNSSAGILEAPILKLPVVNVGNRQKGRFHADNVQFAPHDVDAICAAVRRAVHDASYREQVAACSNPYGDGRSGQRIADLLAEFPVDEELLIKDITY